MTIKVGRYNDPGAIYIGRENKGLGLKGSPLANQFVMRDNSIKERNRVCNQYDLWIRNQIGLQNRFVINEIKRLIAIWKKEGHIVLGCFCSPKRCHGDIIKNLMILFKDLQN